MPYQSFVACAWTFRHSPLEGTSRLSGTLAAPPLDQGSGVAWPRASWQVGAATRASTGGALLGCERYQRLDLLSLALSATYPLAVAVLECLLRRLTRNASHGSQQYGVVPTRAPWRVCVRSALGSRDWLRLSTVATSAGVCDGSVLTRHAIAAAMAGRLLPEGRPIVRRRECGVLRTRILRVFGALL